VRVCVYVSMRVLVFFFPVSTVRLIFYFVFIIILSNRKISNQYETPDIIKKAVIIQYRNIKIRVFFVYAIRVIQELGYYSKNIAVVDVCEEI